MSSLFINISFGIWYLQIGSDWPFVRFSAHPFPEMIKVKPWFVVHKFFGYTP